MCTPTLDQSPIDSGPSMLLLQAAVFFPQMRKVGICSDGERMIAMICCYVPQSGTLGVTLCQNIVGLYSPNSQHNSLSLDHTKRPSTFLAVRVRAVSCLLA